MANFAAGTTDTASVVGIEAQFGIGRAAIGSMEDVSAYGTAGCRRGSLPEAAFLKRTYDMYGPVPASIDCQVCKYKLKRGKIFL
ncbi:hypothetical protein A9Q95_05125 [Rhodobacterales bacterium 59_46_T64]|nr:hypothetical protein A9Q95_05125 [Rhodobacterales bacterium 59_46_T64]